MNLINRAKNLLLTPQTEWLAIRTENTSANVLLKEYVLPLSIIPAIIAFLTTLIWSNFTFGLISAVITICSALISFYLGTYITDYFATSFSSEKNYSRSAQLVGYSYTAIAIAAIFSVIPVLGFIAVSLGFAYSIYLMFLGASPIKNTPAEKRTNYVIVIMLVQIVIYFIITSVLGSLFLPMLTKF